MMPKTEEEALLMYAAGLEYLKRTNSKLLPKSEAAAPAPAPVQARKPITDIDFSKISQNKEVERLKLRIVELEAEVRSLELRLHMHNQTNTWPYRPNYILGQGTGVNPDAGMPLTVSKDGELNVTLAQPTDTVKIFGDVTFKGNINDGPKN